MGIKCLLIDLVTGYKRDPVPPARIIPFMHKGYLRYGCLVMATRPNFKNVLITGGAGFIGCNFVRLLLEDRLSFTANRIVVIDSLTYASDLESIQEFIDSKQLDFIYGDITDSTLILEITRDTDLIVNFAAESHVDRSILESNQFILSNVLGVDNLLIAARKNRVQLFIQVSTDEVYGSILSGSWDESFPLKPNSPYSASKASAELISMAHNKTHGLDIRITRCCNNYGQFQNQEKFIPTCINKLINNQKIPIYGSGAQIREWIHVDDHCIGIGLVISNGRAGEIYNIGSGQEATNLELALVIASEFQLGEEVIAYVEDRKGHDFRYSLNFNKIKEIGFAPSKDWRNEIPNLISWYTGRSKRI